MKRFLAPILLIIFILFSEYFSYKAFSRLSNQSKKAKRIWWTTTILLYIGFFWVRTIDSNYISNWYVNFFAIVLILKFSFGLFYGLAEGIRLFKKQFRNKSNTKNIPEYSQSRRKFNAQLALGLTTIPFFEIHWGLFRTAYNFKLHKHQITIPNLPKTFRGFKIVQLSDIHTGSLQSRHQLQKAIQLAMAQNPDVICFTGDLVNNRTDEVFPYLDDLKLLKAPCGVISILGNHDYGDYETWNSSAEKEANLKEMHAVHTQLGWELLLNSHLSIEKNDDKIFFLGVENWGANLHFPKYGKLDRAYFGLKKEDVKILLSHDPSHFDTEVTSKYKDIQLTLSGHTHGFQFGVEIPGYVKWSPSQYFYRQWAGLYRKGNQQVYVNRGMGCLGYMGRIGIRPEVTMITLV